MPFNTFKKMIVYILCVILITSLCACSPYIDQDFINLNMTAQSKPTQPTEPEYMQPESTTPPTEPEDESKPAFKPGGFTLPDEKPSEPETEPVIEETTTPDNTEPTTPKPPSSVIVDNVKVSAGLKSALNSIGKTNTLQVVAFQPNAGADGGRTIVFVKNNGSKAIQYTYMYYESESDYTAASTGMSDEACNTSLRLILRGEMEVLPVTNPETMGIVLFDCYVLGR